MGLHSHLTEKVSLTPLTAHRKIYADLHYSIQDVQEAAGGDIALSSDKVKVLMGRMREPSLSLHGIEGAFSGVGAKTVIPAKVSGKFSIRLVIPSFHTFTQHSFPHESRSATNTGNRRPPRR